MPRSIRESLESQSLSGLVLGQWAECPSPAVSPQGQPAATSWQRTPRSLTDGGKQRLSQAGANEDDVVYADLANAPSIISIVFPSPYTATNEPKRGPFSWPSNT